CAYFTQSTPSTQSTLSFPSFPSTPSIGTDHLREYLSTIQPDYMIPAIFIELENFPLNPNGKVDRKALSEYQKSVSQYRNKYKAPGNTLEKKLVEIWSVILEIDKDKIGTGDNFFHLGGHSLKAMQFSTRVHKELKVKIPLAEIFKRPDIEKIAAYIEAQPGGAEEKHSMIDPVEEKEYYALSPAQKRIYILQQMDPANMGYNMPAQFRLRGTLNKTRLEETFRQLIARFESLRTSIHMIAETPVQRIHHDVPFEI
ncbi:MAG: hypothetical protein GY757_47260, partial [bacterium]|nr:hypothetical protein [bacterium]